LSLIRGLVDGEQPGLGGLRATLIIADKKENQVAFLKDAANNGFIRRIICGY